MVPEGALAVFRRGIAASPILRRGIMSTIGLGASVAAARLVAPVLLQFALDSGVLGEKGIRPGVVLRASIAGAIVIVAASALSYVMQCRLVRRAEAGVAELRTRAFEHVHRLSVADHNETRRGILVARVTSDANALGAFIEWGMLSWIIQPMVIGGTFVVLSVYAWQLAVIALLAYAPVIPAMRFTQRRMFAAYDQLRTETGSMLATFGESISGAAVIRAYGVQAQAQRQLRAASRSAYQAMLRANRYMASVTAISDLFGALSFVSVLAAGIWYHESWGISAGELTACLFLTTLVHHPIAELGESLDEAQAAAAGWSKILILLDRAPDIPEPLHGQSISPGPIAVDVDDVSFAYRRSPAVLHSVSCRIPAGANLAVVGETGSGKTTFAKLLCRLADPTTGEIRLNGAPLPSVASESRLASVRMVPQDGFLFDVSIRENVRYGRPAATDADIDSAFAAIGLSGWAEKFSRGARHPSRRARREPFGGRATAGGPCPGGSGRSRSADSRRGHLSGRSRNRPVLHHRPAPAGERPHGHQHRLPTGDGRGRRLHPGVR